MSRTHRGRHLHRRHEAAGGCHHASALATAARRRCDNLGRVRDLGNLDIGGNLGRVRDLGNGGNLGNLGGRTGDSRPPAARSRARLRGRARRQATGRSGRPAPRPRLCLRLGGNGQRLSTGSPPPWDCLPVDCRAVTCSSPLPSPSDEVAVSPRDNAWMAAAWAAAAIWVGVGPPGATLGSGGTDAGIPPAAPGRRPRPRPPPESPPVLPALKLCCRCRPVGRSGRG